MSDVLVCPVCNGDVRRGTSMCLNCHLPFAHVERHQPKPPTWADRTKRLRSAIFGIVVYAAIAAWMVVRLPDTVTFVAPGSVTAIYLHAIKGQRVLGLLAFGVIVIVLPAIFWPSMLTGAFSDWTNF